MKRNLLDGLIYLALGLCVLAGAADLLYLHFPDWALLAFTALVGAAAGGLVPARLRATQAWIALVALTWVAFFYVLGAASSLGHVARLFLPWPLAASVGVAAGLAAWRLPRRLRWWRPLPLVLGAAAVVGIMFISGGPEGVGASPSSSFHPFRAPAYTLHLLDGGTVHSSSLEGKTVVLAFWATWCKPCREELPRLQALYRKHYANRSDVVFYVVDFGDAVDTPGKARAWLEKYGIALSAAFDADGALMRKLHLAPELPARVVIGPDGIVDYRAMGYGSYDSGFSRLRAAIAGKPKAGTAEEPPDAQ